MKKIKLQQLLVAGLILTSALSFFFISRAIKVPEASIWLVPILWMSFFLIVLNLVSILAGNKLIVELFIALSLLTSLFFSFNFVHFFITIFCILLILDGARAIKNDLDLNIKINLWKSLYVGKFKMILAMSILISSQYFFTINSLDVPVNVPKFDFSSVSGKLVVPILGFVNPQFAEAGRENLTVDQFILQSQQGNDEGFSSEDEAELIESNIPQNLPSAERDALKKQSLQQINETKTKLVAQNQDLVLREGRLQFSKLAGRKVEGNEKVTDVFTGMINSRINNYFQPQIDEPQKSDFLPFVLTMILFVTIWPLGSLLSTLWFGIVILIFKALVKFEFVQLEKVNVERETIVF